MSLPCLACSHELSAPAPTCPACGASLQIGGSYALERLLGRGAGTRVYAARDPESKPVAVKMLCLAESDWHAAEAFRKGVGVLRGLEHPSVPKLVDFSEDDRGNLYLVRELLAGGSLRQRIDENRRIEAAAFRTLLESLLRLAEYLHGLVPPALHCNIKPANILFRADASWIPVLVDFESVSDPEQGLTLLGAAGYVAPELQSGRLDARTDLYAIGASLLALATHTEPDELPRNAERFTVDERLSLLDSASRRVLTGLLAFDPDKRLASATAALAELARPELPAPTKPPPRASARTVVAAITMLLLVGVAAGVLVAGAIAAERVAAIPEAGCRADWLSLDEVGGSEPYCVRWHSEPVLTLGCTDDRRKAEYFCAVVTGLEHPEPDELDMLSAIQIAEQAKKLELSLAAEDRPNAPFLVAAGSPAISPSSAQPKAHKSPVSAVLPSPADVRVAPTAPPATPATPSEPSTVNTGAGEGDSVRIELLSTPAGATVRIDDRSCVTPCTLEAPRGGNYQLVFELDGYERVERKLRALSNKTVEVKLKAN